MATNRTDDYRVLSIQSHVVSGYVGNKSAVFPLQVLGFEVDAINSVQFCNHTGYDHMAGQVLNSNDLKALYKGLEDNKLNQKYSHVLTGYVGNESFLETVAEVVTNVKTINPKAFYVCDPVMGDNGKMYVPQELLPVFRDKVIPIADIITPNQFEAELLTDIKIKDVSDAIKAIDALHSRGIPTVIITSSDLSQNDSELVAIASTRVKGRQQRVKLLIPKLKATFTGTGDLFTALFMAWFTKTDFDLKTSCEKTVSTLQLILKKTYDYAVGQDGGTQSAKNVELRLVQSLSEILNPKNGFNALDIK